MKQDKVDEKWWYFFIYLLLLAAVVVVVIFFSRFHYSFSSRRLSSARKM